MHNTTCAIMHLLVTYQKKSANFIQCQYIGVFQDRSTVSSLCVRESMVDCLRDQLIPPASLLVSRRGFSRAWKPGDEPVGSGWSRRQSTMDYLSHPLIIFSKYIYFIQ